MCGSFPGVFGTCDVRRIGVPPAVLGMLKPPPRVIVSRCPLITLSSLSFSRSFSTWTRAPADIEAYLCILDESCNGHVNVRIRFHVCQWQVGAMNKNLRTLCVRTMRINRREH